MSEIILDSAIDSIKLLPFLFLTYLFMEWLEHKTGSAARNRIRTAGKLGPVWGGLLGVIPQCGFSAAASSLFSGRVITVGTLIAVYLSTSDEMFPIMISNAVPVVTIVKILTCKAVIGILSGLVLEYVYTHILKKQEPDVDIHEICEEERCHCEHGVISSAAFHTLKVFVYIFLISLVLNIIIGLVGEETLAGLFTGTPIACDEGELEWVEKSKIGELELWEGDRIFFELLENEQPFFSLKLVYNTDDVLEYAALDGKKMKDFRRREC
mgnify:CR=1 FL=1